LLTLLVAMIVVSMAVPIVELERSLKLELVWKSSRSFGLDIEAIEWAPDYETLKHSL